MLATHEIHRLAAAALMGETTVRRVYKLGVYREYRAKPSSVLRAGKAALELGLPLPPDYPQQLVQPAR